MENIKFTLEKLPHDPRDYSHHKHFGTLGATQLPTKDFTIYDSFSYTIKWGDTLSSIAKKFGFTLAEIQKANNIINPNKIRSGQVITIPSRPIKILDQTDLDFCSAFLGVETQYALWGIEMCPLWLMSQEKKLRGEYKGFGANLRDVTRALVKVGSLPKILSPYTHNTGNRTDKERDFLANWTNWATDLYNFAIKYKDASYFNVDGPLDDFDDIRSALWINRQERRIVLFGSEWMSDWVMAKNGIIPKEMPENRLGGHAYGFIGQKTINGEVYLIKQGTWGEKYGDHGLYYFPRNIVNQMVKQGYGKFTVSRTNKTGMIGSVVGDFINLISNKLLGIFK